MRKARFKNSQYTRIDGFRNSISGMKVGGAHCALRFSNLGAIYMEIKILPCAYISVMRVQVSRMSVPQVSKFMPFWDSVYMYIH